MTAATKVLHMRVSDATSDYVHDVALRSGLPAARVAGLLLDYCRREGISKVEVSELVTVSGESRSAPFAEI